MESTFVDDRSFSMILTWREIEATCSALKAHSVKTINTFSLIEPILII